MEYKKCGNRFIVRLDRGEDINTKVMELIRKERITLASLTGIGAVDRFAVGGFSMASMRQFRKEFEGVYEIASLTGLINTMGGEPYIHLHIICADEEGQCYGGHLFTGRVSCTCEMVITLMEGETDRIREEATGINLLKL